MKNVRVEDPKFQKLANNILEFLVDPTKTPVKQRIYFRPEENLQNQSYEGAKADAQVAYHDQRHNSDFYPIRNRQQQTQREASIMDRKELIASLDVLSQNFSEDDPIAKDLRTMAYAMSQMKDDEIQQRLASSNVEANAYIDFGKKYRKDHAKDIEGKPQAEIMKEIGKAWKAQKKEASGTYEKCGKEPCECDSAEACTGKEATVKDFWSKEASEAVKAALIGDVFGTDDSDDDDDETSKDAAGTHQQPHVPHQVGQLRTEYSNPDMLKQYLEEWAQKGSKEPWYAKIGPEIKRIINDLKGIVPEMPVTASDQNQRAMQNWPAEGAAPEAAPVVEPEKTVPVAEPAKEEAPAVEPTKKETTAVDTSMLMTAFGIEMEQGMITAEDVGELTADEKANLDRLFQ